MYWQLNFCQIPGQLTFFFLEEQTGEWWKNGCAVHPLSLQKNEVIINFRNNKGIILQIHESKGKAILISGWCPQSRMEMNQQNETEI